MNDDAGQWQNNKLSIQVNVKFYAIADDNFNETDFTGNVYQKLL